MVKWILSKMELKKIEFEFSKHFDFLQKEFKMNVIKEIPLSKESNNYVRVIRNNYVQIELAGNENYFHAEIRRLVNGKTKQYSDRENNIGFESLAVLLNNNNYNHFDYYVPTAGLTKVLENCAKLFKNSKSIFITNQWVDIKKIEYLKDEEFFKKFGSKPSSKLSFFNLVKEKAADLFTQKGYIMTFDNSKLPPYNRESLTEKIIFEKEKSKITFAQKDWRDNYREYFIDVNGRIEFKIDMSENSSDINNSANIVLKELDKLAEKNL